MSKSANFGADCEWLATHALVYALTRLLRQVHNTLLDDLEAELVADGLLPSTRP